MPTSKSTTIRFQYFRTCYMRGNGDDDCPYDLSEFWTYLEHEDLTNRIKEFNHVKCRLEQSYRNHHHPNLIVLRFMRLDEISDTYTVRPGEEAQHVDLEDDEYLGRNALVLYDSERKVIMVQSSRGGLSWRNIMGYINEFSFLEDKCYFKPLLDSQDLIQKINKGGKITKVKLSFSDVRHCNAQRSKAYEHALDFSRGMGSITAKFELGLGRGRHERPLRSKESIDLIRDIAQDQAYISTAQFRIDADGLTEFVDLMPSAIRSEIEVKLEARKEINFENAINLMLLKYTDTMGRINAPW